MARVDGSLTLRQLPLGSLRGAEALTGVGADLTISSTLVTELESLTSLTDIGRDAHVELNPLLCQERVEAWAIGLDHLCGSLITANNGTECL